MNSAKWTYEQLLEKIIRARMHLENVPRPQHSNFCPVEDPESYAPCTCGASGKNKHVDSALRELKL